MIGKIGVGSPAPAFTMPASGGCILKSDNLRGRPYLLYFYPRADAPGCTTQARGVQDALPELRKLSLKVVGVSPDSIRTIESFAKKLNLAFPLASDADNRVAEAYGTWVETSRYGKR